MGNVFTLTPDIKAIATGAIDDLITQLGKDCLLVYPPSWTPCVNCGAGNRWVTGGPAPFPDGAVCPVCDGSGQRADEVTATVRMLVAVGPAQFFKKLPVGVQVPDGLIQTKGFVADLPKVLQAREMVLQPGTLPVKLRYVLAGEPVDAGSIIQNRYFVCEWRRAGG